jgi:VanZ family protein
MGKRIKILSVLLFIWAMNNILSANNEFFSFDKERCPKHDSITSLNKGRLITVISTVSVLHLGSMAYLQYIWYKDHQRVPFEFYNDLGGYNQIDKFGHIYGAYLESYIGFHALLWAGVSRKKAILYGGSLGFLLQLPIEIWDGIYEGWGFSWSDVGANTLGSLLVIGQEFAFHEQIVKYKFTFSPSPYAPQANGYLGNGFNQLFYDYNGHTYWLSTGINQVIKNRIIPDWVNFAVGYGAGGMFGEFENLKQYKGVKIPATERYRKFLFSFDIDFSKIPVRNKNLKRLFNSMFMIKVPFPAIEFNTKGEIKFHPLYY